MIVFYGMLLYVSLSDIRRRRIPDGCCLAIAVLAVLEELFGLMSLGWTGRLVGAVCISVPMLLLSVFSSGGFGGGDIKLMAAGGLFLGWRASVTAFVTGLFLSGIYCAYLLLTKRADRKTSIALGPFFCMGIAVMTIFGF